MLPHRCIVDMNHIVVQHRKQLVAVVVFRKIDDEII